MSSFALAACGDGGNGTPDTGVNNVNKDALVNDDAAAQPDAAAMNPDAPNSNRDASNNPDAAVGPQRDGAVPPCMQGTEGCPCDPAMMCGTGLTCIEWPQDVMTDPIIRTCAATCAEDVDCAGNTEGNLLCRAFFRTGGITGICSKGEVAAGAICRGSKRPGSNEITGCAPAEVCLTNLGSAEQGFCAQICQVTTSSPTGGCEGATPYCQPSGSGLVFTSTAVPPVQSPAGTCAVGRITQGQRCARRDPTRSCDTSDLTIVPGNGNACIGSPDLPTTEGLCTEICQRGNANANPPVPNGTCGNNEPGIGRAVCTEYIEDAQDPDASLCVDLCTGGPRAGGVDSCGGPGASGQGRVCQDQFEFAAAFPVSFCVDRAVPTLMEATVADNAGQPQVTQAEDCRPGMGSNGDAYRCPEGTFCATLVAGQPGQGACLRGCTTATTAPATGCTATASVCLGLNPMFPEGLCINN